MPKTVTVALRKESVDRNNDTSYKKKINPVALRKESVDRNRYWYIPPAFPCRVALRKESVDRNTPTASRRKTTDMVALRKESVDRNSRGMSTISYTTGRSPQGERG